MFGRLKNIFRNAATQPAERSIYFHEDDYCQIELLPRSAQQHCVTEMGIIDDFAAKHSDGGMGYTDIYLRPDAPHALSELRLAVSGFASAIQKHLPPYDSVFTGYSSHRERCKRTLAWGDASFVIFADQDAEIVQHAWLSFGSHGLFDAGRITRALRSLPSSDSIIIADWSWSLIASISDARALDEYFRQRTASA